MVLVSLKLGELSGVIYSFLGGDISWVKDSSMPIDWFLLFTDFLADLGEVVDKPWFTFLIS